MNTTEATIDIAAPPRIVWSILTTWADYAAWNPFIAGIEGEAELGGRIFVRLKLGRGTLRLRARVTRFEPESELAWRATLPIAGLFDRDHIFRIDERPGGCRLRQTQIFVGSLSPFFAATAGGVVRRGIARMNGSIKRRAEDLAGSGERFRPRPAGPGTPPAVNSARYGSSTADR